jgi:acetate---CoA ligase (ADP-forming) subunit beta
MGLDQLILGVRNSGVLHRFARRPNVPAMSRTLSEAASKELLSGYGVPFPPERLTRSAEEAVEAASELGFPVAAKLCGERIAHKTERGLVRLGLAEVEAVRCAAKELFAAARPEDGVTGVLVAPMLSGRRELIAGVSTDPQFGPTVLFGVGGVMAELIADVAVRPAPITRLDAEDMLDQLDNRAILGEFRGEAAADRDRLVDVLIALSNTVSERPDICSIDLNPLIIEDGSPMAVDALVELAG